MGKRQQQKRKSSSNVRRTRTVKVKGEAPGVMVQQKEEQQQQQQQEQQEQQEQQQEQRRRPKISSSSTSLPLLPPRPPTTRTTASPSKSDTHEQEVEQEQGRTSGRRQSPSPPPRFFATDDHPCQTTSQQSAVESIEDSSPQSNMAYPPPPPEIDPAATGGYGAYATNGTTDPYGAVDEHGNQVQHLPPLSEALHTDDINNPGNPADHLNVHGAHYGSHASANAYDPQQQADPSSGAGANQHGQYDQHSSNFFDTQHMEPPPPADGTGHHAAHNTATINSQNHANGYGAAIMTPPPPASSQGYPSSPYQSAGASAPLFHRASISGPVMHNHYAAPTGAPSTANHSADVWSSTPAAARPHTADGMFASHMGGLPGQWASISDYNRGPRGSIGSMSDAAPSGGGKVFSYMPSNGDDSSSTAGSQSHHTSGGPRKRPRRRYDEIERLYTCSWPGCQKSYGTLNHLNAHVAMQKHGPKRSPGEFKEMRKAWRKGKREEEQRRQASAAAANEDALSRSKMMFATPNQPFMTHAGYGMNNFGGQSAHQMPPPAPAPASGSHFPGGLNGRSGAYGYPTGMDTSRSYGGGQGGAASSGGLGAYLMAHRGSI